MRWLIDNISLEILFAAYEMYNKGMLDNAEILYEYLLQLNPAESNALVNLGAIREKKGDLRSAVKYYTEAIRSDADNLDAHYNLAVVYWQMNDWEKVVREFAIVYSINPEYRDVAKFLARAKHELSINK